MRLKPGVAEINGFACAMVTSNASDWPGLMLRIAVSRIMVSSPDACRWMVYRSLTLLGPPYHCRVRLSRPLNPSPNITDEPGNKARPVSQIAKCAAGNRSDRVIGLQRR